MLVAYLIRMLEKVATTLGVVVVLMIGFANLPLYHIEVVMGRDNHF